MFLRTHFQRIIYSINVSALVFQIYLSQCMPGLEVTCCFSLTKDEKKHSKNQDVLKTFSETVLWWQSVRRQCP